MTAINPNSANQQPAIPHQATSQPANSQPAHQQSAWKRAIACWGYPVIDVEHYMSKEEAAKVMGDSIAHFDFSRQRARINIPKLEERLGIDCLEPIDKHEIGHYVFCPYDLKNCLLMIQGAHNVVKDYTKAKHIENIVADMMLNTRIVHKGDNSIITVYERMGKTDDKLWTLVMRSCELLWKLPANKLAHNNKEVEEDAQKIAQVIGNSMYIPAQWADATEQCARIFSKYNIDKDETERRMIDQHSPSDFIGENVGNSIGTSIAGISKSLSYAILLQLPQAQDFVQKARQLSSTILMLRRNT